SLTEVHRFYKRQGAYLALLYALQANDFHFENLIATGEYPIPVDLETLFMPLPPPETDNELPEHLLLMDSVLQVGLLPMRIWTERIAEGIDISGLGMRAGQLTSHPLPVWRQIETDEMHLDREHLPLDPGKHQPVWQGKPVNVTNYGADVVEGFKTVYNLLLQWREELLSANGPLNCVANDKIRFVLRPTQVYALLLQESTHPDLLRDAVDRDQFYDRLWVNSSDSKHFYPVIPFEQDDLWQFDVPIFTTSPDSTDLWTSHGYQIKNFFCQTGLERVKQKLKKFNQADLTQQIWLIKASLATLAQVTHHLVKTKTRSSSPLSLAQCNQFDPQATNKERLLNNATKLGNHLMNTAHTQGEETFWLGMRHDFAGNFYAVEPLGVQLYSGLPGVALFLAYLGHITEEVKYTNMAQRTIRTTLSLLERKNVVIDKVGAFEGWGGLIYTLTHLGTLWDDEFLLKQAINRAEQLPTLITKDNSYDIVTGNAGCIGTLLALHHAVNMPDLLNIAATCGDHLCKQTIEINGSVAWQQHDFTIVKQPLTGFSHGVAGIAWSLMHLAQATGEQKYADIATKSLDYERSLFSVEVQNWPDLRDFSQPEEHVTQDKTVFMNAWCHGAPGIGLARLSTLPWLDNQVVRNEIETAIKTTLAQGFGDSHCLCHGDLGNLELFLQAQRHLGQEFANHTKALQVSILTSVEEDGWLCGNPSHLEEPGLMTGLAGIGYGLLRAAAPEKVPSVLLLEPPIHT
ncbi:MAG: type 2 lanthipeptide synthetase LanM family protein, partial [Chloroflexota bacterium]